MKKRPGRKMVYTKGKDGKSSNSFLLDDEIQATDAVKKLMQRKLADIGVSEEELTVFMKGVK